MDFWRNEAYTKFFEHLDRTGGFYYEVCYWLRFFFTVFAQLILKLAIIALG